MVCCFQGSFVFVMLLLFFGILPQISCSMKLYIPHSKFCISTKWNIIDSFPCNWNENYKIKPSFASPEGHNLYMILLTCPFLYNLLYRHEHYYCKHKWYLINDNMFIDIISLNKLSFFYKSNRISICLSVSSLICP